jgi:hypothetical protein
MRTTNTAPLSLDVLDTALTALELISVMTGMSQMGYIKPNGNIPDIVSKRLEYRRVTPATSPKHENHSKLVVVDDAIC